MFDKKAYMKEYNKNYQEKNKDKIKEYLEKNREKILQRKKEYRENNKDKIQAYREKNRDKIRRKNIEYSKKNREKISKRMRLLRQKYFQLWLKIIKEHNGEIECKTCGYNKNALQFHHKNPEEKEFKLSDFYYKKPTPERIKKFKKELKKCEILCANCHFEIHSLGVFNTALVE